MTPASNLSRRDFLKLSTMSLCAAYLSGCLRLATPAPADYWQANRQRFLDDFDALFNPVRDLLAELTNPTEAGNILAESRTAFEALLPQVPYLGGDDNALTETLYLSGAALAFYRVMLAHGQPLEETGRLIYRAMENLFNFDDPLAGALSGDPNGKAAQDEFRRMAKWSATSPYPADWKLTFIPGEGEAFDFGVDYTACGIVKFFQSQNAAELAPYLCLGDFPLSQALNTGLVRTTTLAHGGPRCDFRFKAGRAIQREWTPEFLKGAA